MSLHAHLAAYLIAIALDVLCALAGNSPLDCFEGDGEPATEWPDVVTFVNHVEFNK